MRIAVCAVVVAVCFGFFWGEPKSPVAKQNARKVAASEPTPRASVAAADRIAADKMAEPLTRLKTPYRITVDLQHVDSRWLDQEITYVERMVRKEGVIEQLNESREGEHERLFLQWSPVFQALTRLRAEKFARELRELNADLSRLQKNQK